MHESVLRAASLIRRHPVSSYFILTFGISWSAALCVAAPHLLRREPLPQLTGILMFPVMLLGPSLSGIFLTWLIDGKAGLRDLFSRLFRWRVPVAWYAILLLPPALVLAVLFCLKTFVSPIYAPNRFWFGILFGVPAGILEEIGWMGFAFPKLLAMFSKTATGPESAKPPATSANAFSAAVVLGIFWALWHLPVINFLGTATPHGDYWLPFFFAFGFAMMAMRVLICWSYANTGSVLLAQLIHISSTGSLVIFTAPGVTAAQEALWYAIYAAALWLIVAIVVMIFGTSLSRCNSIVPARTEPL